MSKKENQRTEDSIIGMPRAVIFIITTIITIVLTVLCLYKFGFLVLNKNQTPEVKNIQQPQSVIHTSNNYDYSPEISFLNKEIDQLWNGYESLQQQLDDSKNVPQQHVEVIKNTTVSSNNSAIALLNYLILSYNKGEDITTISYNLVPYLETDLIKESFQNLVNLTQEGKPISRMELFFKLRKSMKSKEPIVEEIEEQNGFKKALSSLVVIRKKDEDKGSTKKLIKTIKSKIMLNKLDDLEEFLAKNPLNKNDRLADVSNLLTKYLSQQKALNIFKSNYINHHMDQVK